MELGLIAAIVFSVAANTYFIFKTKTTNVYVTVNPTPVDVTPDFHVEIPEPMVLVNTPEIDYDRLEAIIEKIVVAAQTERVIFPTWVQPPPNFDGLNPPIISKSIDHNVVEVDGVKGKQFPAR